MLRAQASSTWTTVEKAETAFCPARALASATRWTSEDLPPTHRALADANTSVRLRTSETATATVVNPPSSSLKSASTGAPGGLPLSPDANPLLIAPPHPFGP